MQTIDNVRMKYFIVRRNMTQNFKKESTSFFNSGFNYFFQLIFTFLETNKKKNDVTHCCEVECNIVDQKKSVRRRSSDWTEHKLDAKAVF